MKRKIFGGLAVLSAALVPFSGVASAASTVDYEKSVGQVDGADTINWVVEATNDGGYVVGGQTVACYRESHAAVKKLIYPDGPQGEKVAYEECVKYYASHPILEELSNTDESSSAPSVYDLCAQKHVLARKQASGGGLGLMANGDGADAGETDEEEYYYSFSCVDYIAKFKTNGTKEWLTTINDGNQPIAVKKINDGSYRLLTNSSTLYTFSAKGVEGISKGLLGYYDNAYFNNDGSFVAQYDDYMIDAYNTNGVKQKTIGGSGDIDYSSLLPAGMDKYVALGCVVNVASNNVNDSPVPIGLASTSNCSIYDINKDLASVKKRELKNFDSSSIKLVSANKYGDVAVVTVGEDGLDAYSYDKDGNKIGEMKGVKLNPEAVKTYKDFAIGEVKMSDEKPITNEVTMYNRDLSVKYNYSGSGHEIVNDVVLLNDDSLVGVGVAFKDSTTIPVTGNANGGYMRLTAKQQETQKPTAKPNVKNPKTWDAVDTIATIGGIALLGLGVFLRKSLNRR